MKNYYGKVGKCECCGDKGLYCYDPYEEEIHCRLKIVCLCENCYKDYCDDI